MYLFTCAHSRYYNTYEECLKAAKRYTVDGRQDQMIFKAIAKTVQPVPEVEVELIEEKQEDKAA